jgi:hypothetical protein
MIYKKTWEEHVENVDQYLQPLHNKHFFLKISKHFDSYEVEYFVPIVSRTRVQVNIMKINAIVYCPHPKTLKITCGFLGLVFYY